MTRKLRTLLFSSLYPSSIRPGHGIFVETRLRELLASGQIETRVVSPVPWFFSTHARFGNYALMARTPKQEKHHGVDVSHPRYFVPPKVGMTIAPIAMALGALPAVRQMQREGFDFDLIDAHYYYPDGVAAALLAGWVRKPFVVTARGTDLNLIPNYSLPRRMIKWAANLAQASIGVSSALIDILRGWDVPAERLLVMRNGVDLERFKPVEQLEARRVLAIHGSPILLSVGHLVENKGHHIAIQALAIILKEFPQAKLVLVGEGPERQRLQLLVERLGVASSVHFAGSQPNSELLHWYSAADVLLLASSREGWPNVLLESMACGTPVIACRVGGIPEIVTDESVGLLADLRNPTEFAGKIKALLGAHPDRIAVRAYAERFSWQATTDAQLQLFERLTGLGRSYPIQL